MKIKYFNTLLLVLLVGPLYSYANHGAKKEKVKREIHKEFNVNDDALLHVRNKYGDVNLTSWDQPQVVIDVEIIVEGNSMSRIESKLEDIEIEFDAQANRVSAITHIEESWKNNFFFGSNSVDFEINYTIKLPVNNQVHLINDYGTISLNQLNGRATIDCDYGKLIVGELNADDNEINLDYTRNSTIEYLKSGKIDADYSDFEIGESRSIALQADYTDAHFGSIESLRFDNDYGKITVNMVNELKGTGDYVSYRVGTVKKSLEIDADYGSLKIEKILAGFDKIDINTDYTSTQLGINQEAAFGFQIDLDYGGFNSELPLVYEKEITKNSIYRYYEGYHLTKGKSLITIESDYGSIKIKATNN